MAAAAAFANAKELCAEAKLLVENDHRSRATALAVIGLEEFAKGVAYAVAAVFPEQDNGIRKLLRQHEVKHWIADTFEGAQIVVTDEWPLVVFQETGSWPPAEEVLRNIFVELSKRGLGDLIPSQADAEKYRKKMKLENKEHIWTQDIKNAALYVDISGNGEVLLPDRVERYTNSEINGLARYLGDIRLLVDILSDDKKWTRFAEDVRVRIL
jgi:hypothetical protein